LDLLQMKWHEHLTRATTIHTTCKDERPDEEYNT